MSKQKKKVIKKTSAWIAILAGLLLLILTGIYAVSIYKTTSYVLPSRAHQDVLQIQDWMTVRYVARIYVVPEVMLSNRLGISVPQASRMSIKAIARVQHKTPAAVISLLQMTITAYKQSLP